MDNLILLYATLMCIVSNVPGNAVLVEVEQGVLSGELLPLVTNDGYYYSFKGIPYAQPPVGPLRFKAPEPPLRWDGIRNATEHGPICPQVDVLTNVLHLSYEDCLFLNVYTPNIMTDVLLPVMFFIHGGGFTFGSGDVDNYGPDFLVAKEVVLVTTNYRLDALGNLCLENEDVPGNAALKDQLAALKWVKTNIDKFGGNPEMVTIFGQSAGAASVLFHCISPLSKGYFQRAIAMSGSPYSDWAINYKPARRAFALARSLGYETKNKTDLLTFLQDVSYEKLVNATPTILASEEITNSLLKLHPFVPVNEGHFSKEAFLPGEPIELVNAGKVNDIDLMAGYTDMETLTIISMFEETLLALYNKYSEMLVPTKIVLNQDPSTVLHISDIIHQYYFGDQSINATTMKEMVYFTSNASFVYDIHRFVRGFPNPGNKSRYFYKFSCYSSRNVYSTAGAEYGLYGAGHLDDLMYLFDAKSLNMTIDKNSMEYYLINQTTTLFTNFAKYGNPTPDSSLGIDWPLFDAKTLAYAEIGNTLSISCAPDEEDMQFWKSILESVGIPFV